MIDFSTLKGLTIPEGAVTQITDAAGNVLWKQAPSEAKITIIGNGGNYANVVIDGVTYNTAAEVTVPIGTVITPTIPSTAQGAGVYYNFERVAVGDYIVSSDMTIVLHDHDPSGVGQLHVGMYWIMDKNAPPYATMTITKNLVIPYARPSVTACDITHQSPGLVPVPIGSTVLCSPINASSARVDGVVYLNGEVVATGTSYEYILAGDVGIEFRITNRGAQSNPTGYFSGDIHITEL